MEGSQIEAAPLVVDHLMGLLTKADRLRLLRSHVTASAKNHRVFGEQWLRFSAGAGVAFLVALIQEMTRQRMIIGGLIGAIAIVSLFGGLVEHRWATEKELEADALGGRIDRLVEELKAATAIYAAKTLT